MIEIDPKIFETGECLFEAIKPGQHFVFYGDLYRKLMSAVIHNSNPCNVYCVGTGEVTLVCENESVRPVEVKVMKA